MKQQVNDVNDTLTGLLSGLQQLRKTVDSQHAGICSLNRNVSGLLKENRDLRRRLSKYEGPPMNSGNSSTPPSKESVGDEAVRRTKSLRKPTNRKPGGQPGHEGSTLEMSENVDRITEIMPDICDACNDSLDDCDTVPDYITQIIYLPQLKPVITEVRH